MSRETPHVSSKGGFQAICRLFAVVFSKELPFAFVRLRLLAMALCGPFNTFDSDKRTANDVFYVHAYAVEAWGFSFLQYSEFQFSKSLARQTRSFS
ncbi:hypothetical protein [uncultured Roseobacter sp.]|uniref:hypothetical protein n=1 Tax=uncultured Roseobacter sp. TaxID=114847 RepID=UPI00261D8164|nr:hypothetical protein [uncultured Roseobacter sp.]